MPAVRIRALTLQDTRAILDIDQRVTRVARRDADNDLWRLIAETTTCFGAETDGVLVGFVLADVRPWEFGNRAHVGWVIALGVDPRHQGKGIGKQLGQRVLEEFRRLGVTQFKTLVDRTDDGLLRYFKVLGFREGREVVLDFNGQRRSSSRTKARRPRMRSRARRRR